VDCVFFVAFAKEEPKRCQGAHFCERTEKKAGQQMSRNILAISEVEPQSLCKGQFFWNFLKALL